MSKKKPSSRARGSSGRSQQSQKPAIYTPKDIKGMDIADVVKVALQLRYVSDAAEQSFIGFLMMVEENADWRPAGATFYAFLTNNNICEPRRYSVGKLAIQSIEQPVRHAIGMKASMAAMRIENASQRYDCLQTMVATAQNTGAPLSERNARAIVKNYITIPARVRESSSETKQLRSENTALRQENKLLRERCESLQAELDRLQVGAPRATHGRKSRSSTSATAPQ